MPAEVVKGVRFLRGTYEIIAEADLSEFDDYPPDARLFFTNLIADAKLLTEGYYCWVTGDWVCLPN